MQEETNLLIIEDTNGNPANITLLNLAVERSEDITAVYDLIKSDPSAVVALLIPEDAVDPDIIVRAIKAGAKAYVRKPASSTEARRHLSWLLATRDGK